MGGKGVDRIDSAADALAFIEAHGVVVFAGRGDVPNLVDAIAGERVEGSWWGHAAGKRVFHLANELEDSSDILWCRLVDGKRTLVHRRIWPALARMAGELDPERIASLRQEHTDRGAHRTIAEPFATWVTSQVRDAGERLTREQAIAMLPAAALPKKVRPV
jgi:hypothetical protein